MLEEASDDTAHADVFAHAGNAGTQHAHAPDEQLDRYARLRCPVERTHDVSLGQGVDLRTNARGAPVTRVLGLAIDARDQFAVQRYGSDPQLFVIADLREAGQGVEEL